MGYFLTACDSTNGRTESNDVWWFKLDYIPGTSVVSWTSWQARRRSMLVDVRWIGGGI